MNNVGEINEVSTPSISTMVSPEYQAVDHFISKEDVSGILLQSFLKKEPTEVTPIEEGGEVVMYLARFDEGWALVAADDRAENQILAFEVLTFDILPLVPQLIVYTLIPSSLAISAAD